MTAIRKIKEITAIITATLIFLGTVNSYATLSEDSKNYETSETKATDEEWEEENDISHLNLDYQDSEKITVYLNDSKILDEEKTVEKDGTVYVPLRTFYSYAGFSVDFNPLTLKITIKREGYEINASLWSDKCTVNGTETTLSHKIQYENGCILAPMNMLSVTMNAKVWYDENAKMLVVSTGKYKDDEILRIVGGKLYMNGEPYYEISFNKFDLCYQIHAGYYYNHEWPEKKYQIDAAEDALKQLHELGFQSIRVFVNSTYRSTAMKNDDDMENYMKAMDDLFDLCDKYDIKMVVCMNLFDGAFYAEGENFIDLIGDPESQSRKNLYRYLDIFIERFKTRKSVLMWEVTNEGNLEADLRKISARQIGNFYADVNAKIKTIDPDRLLTGGDGGLRGSQWHMYTASRTGTGAFWGTDTLIDRFRAYEILYHGVDVISIHPYGLSISKNYVFVADDVFEVKDVDFDYMMYESKVLGKPFYNGEVAVNADNIVYDDSFDNTLNEQYLDNIINSGIQISHWWTFHTDRQGFNDGYGWDITYGKLLDSIIAANMEIKARYCVNKYESENSDSSPVDGSDIVFDKEFYLENNGVFSDLPLIFPVAGVIIIGLVVIALIILIKYKNKHKRKV